MGYTEAELSVLIVDDSAMAELNEQYRQVGHATDVLSFSMLEGECGDVCPEMLGDVVISAETAQEISERTGAPRDVVMELLLIHGILHLLGFDHEAGPEEAARMRARTQELLALLGRSDGEFAWFFEGED